MLFVAIPAYQCSVGVETVRALLNEQAAAHVLGIEMQIAFVPGTSAIWQARNQIAAEFMASGAHRLVMVDADVSWEPGTLIKHACHDVDFVGGAYRYKSDVEGYPVGWLKPEIWADPKTGLIDVAHVPGGFVCVKRSVFEKLAEAHPGRAYSFQGHAMQAFFHVPPGGGEDGAFCDDWRAIGGQVWLDPELTLTHTEGTRKYVGHVGNWLRSRIVRMAAE